MNIYFTVSLILAAVSGIFSLVRQLQMLQQNSYFPSRYFKFVTDGFVVWLTLLTFLFCISSFIYSANGYVLHILLTACTLLVRIPLCVRGQKKSVKPLVFTGRIKRLICAAALIQAILIALYCALPSFVGEFCLVISFMLSFISPLMCLLCWAVTLPIEKLFTAYYINDAKKILASYKNLTVIGVTGSYGKTTTKFILKRLLSEKYNVVCTPGSFNTPMGVVRTVREQLKPQTQIFICEMGAKNVGDIKEICEIANPDIAVITSVGPQHLETFKTVDNVYKTKFELADFVRAKGGSVFINGDSKEIAARSKDGYLVYGTGENALFRAENIAYGSFGSKFDLCLEDKRIDVRTHLLGVHSIVDILAAAAVAHKLGVKSEEIRYAVSLLQATEHRLELKSYINGSTLIDDAYNSNPEGCLEAVNVLGSFEGMKKVIITPGLVELGAKEYEYNKALGLAAAQKCDIIILVGKNRSKPIKEGVLEGGFSEENLYIAGSFLEASNIFSAFADKDTVLLIENDLPDNYLN